MISWLRQVAPHRPADGSRFVAEPDIDPLHRLVALLGPGHDLADAVGGRPGELTSLECRRQAAATPATVDDREPVLGPRRIVGPGQEAGVPDDDPVLERDEGAGWEGGLL